MKYIIDANNLAGKLKMLGNKNFDKKLIKMIQNFTRGKKNEIIIVFDPRDEWGDRVVASDKITVVYSPKDIYYESADDKIVEIISKHLTIDKEELTIITDDVGLRKRIEKLAKETARNINFIRATEYADKLLNSIIQDKEDTKDTLSREDEDKINRELLKIWQ